MDYDIKDTRLKKNGKLKIEWADRNMPVLQSIRKKFRKKKPLKGMRISACLHVTSETANLMRTLKDGGARVALTASNPLSTQDDVAASLVKDYGIPVFAIKGESDKVYYQHIDSALRIKPNITMDDGADLISSLHLKKRDLLPNVIGGTEETTTGVIRLKSMAKKGVLEYPIIAVNDSYTKYLFDNRYGTGQSTLDGILRATNILISGSTVVVAGYGWCGRGLALRAKGMGANVIVTEVDAVKALEAIMDGFRVLPMKDASYQGDIFVTLTGDINVIDGHHFSRMKDGAIVANAGHFDVEINKKALRKLSRSKRIVRPFVEEYVLKSGKRIYLLAEGRLVNLSAAEGHPACVMDMSFANQSKAALYLKENATYLGKKVYKLPDEIDKEIAKLKLKCLKVRYDKLTKEQEEYLNSWKIGT
jgi:adenosylhomocysteinase